MTITLKCIPTRLVQKLLTLVTLIVVVVVVVSKVHPHRII